jgi:hypothetical protein
MDLTGTHRESEERVDQGFLEGNNFSRTTRAECVWEKGETNDKK